MHAFQLQKSRCESAHMLPASDDNTIIAFFVFFYFRVRNMNFSVCKEGGFDATEKKIQIQQQQVDAAV